MHLESFPEALTRTGEMPSERFQNHYLSLIQGNVLRVRRAVKDSRAAVYITCSMLQIGSLMVKNV